MSWLRGPWWPPDGNVRGLGRNGIAFQWLVLSVVLFIGGAFAVVQFQARDFLWGLLLLLSSGLVWRLAVRDATTMKL